MQGTNQNPDSKLLETSLCVYACMSKEGAGSRPEDERRLQGHKGSVVVRDHAWSVIGCRTSRWYARDIKEAIGRTDQRLAPGHYLAERLGTVLAVGVNLHPHRLRIDFIKIHLHLEDVRVAVGVHCNRTETQL